MNREELLKVAKPILFNTEMVRAILDGRKTVTRRVIKPRYEGYIDVAIDVGGELKLMEICENKTLHKDLKPLYHQGDILYVRETWQYLYELDGNEQIIEETGKYYYPATDILPFDTYVDSSGATHEKIPWRPSIHMPKEAARIFLKVTDVRVEQLQDMTDDDAYYEGIDVPLVQDILGERYWEHPPLDDFIDLWDSTIKKSDLSRYGWQANPYVWVIEFERIEPTK